jgi:transcriptional regulator with PAS, ATPase and Fis domain
MIMLTTENPDVDAEAMKLGAADFLSKDKLDPALLERSIRYSIKHFRTLQQLREREAQMDAFMKNVPCAVYMKSPDGQYIYANETCAKVFRRAVNDVIGKNRRGPLPKTIAPKRAISINSSSRRTNRSKRPNRTIAMTEAHYWLTTALPDLRPKRSTNDGGRRRGRDHRETSVSKRKSRKSANRKNAASARICTTASAST